ncbi:MAG: FAD-binding oxidoreductase [Pseudomonadota bacterium]
MSHTITLLDRVQLTHDTAHYVFDKPKGYDFAPGQATDLALDHDGWEDEWRPFTFTSLPGADALAFTVKSYADHDGMTYRMAALTPGDTVRIKDPWGAIEDKGPGVFIAGGAGITPFLGILNKRAAEGSLDGCTLIFANDAPRDIILRPLWDGLDALDTTYVLSEDARDAKKGYIDGALLDDLIDDFSQNFYLCGPPKMEEAVAELLTARGVTEDRLIRES